MLVQYDAASKLLSAALNSEDVRFVLKSRDELDTLKLHAKRVLDRQLLADATEFQMRVERWLGVLLGNAKKAGYLTEGRPRKDEDCHRVTLRDLGIDHKLSMRAQRAAALKEDAFAEILSDARANIVSSGARQLNPNSVPRHAATEEEPAASPFDRVLSDGTRLGNVRLGKLRARVEALSSEARLLQAILGHAGGDADALATVASTMSEHTVQEIILALEH